MTFRFKRDAEAYERKMKGEQEEIRRGLRGLPPPAKTFEAICSYWLEHRASQKRSGRHDESIIRAHLRPAFGSFMLHEIGVLQIDRFIVDRAHLNKKTIANHLTLLGAMLNVAKEIGWLCAVPRIRKPKVRVPDDGALATKFLETMMKAEDLLRKQRRVRRSRSAQASADALATYVQWKGERAVVDMPSLLSSALTRRNDLLVFTAEQFTVGVYMAPLLDLAKIARARADLSGFVDREGVHLRWRTGGLNLFPQSDPKAEKIIVHLPPMPAVIAA